MDRRLILIPLIMYLMIVSVIGCSQRSGKNEAERIGIPPSLEPILSTKSPPGLNGADFIPIKPYDRATDLEVLLLSSQSTTFSGMVIEGRYVSSFRRWLRPLPKNLVTGIRKDILGSVKLRGKVFAVPINVDGAVMVYRRDWWEKFGLPPPDTTDSLRRAVRTIRSGEPSMEMPVRSRVPLEDLFWDLAWSYEGTNSPDVYSYPKLHALSFLKEFSLASASDGIQDLYDGRTALIFVNGSTAKKILATFPDAATTLAVTHLPSTGEKPFVIYNGWSMVRPESSGGKPSGWGSFVSPSYQRYLSGRGFTSVLEEAGPVRNPVDKAFKESRFVSSPDLLDMEREVLYGAVLDAVEAGLPPEEALRRADARLNEMRQSRE